MEPRLEPEEEKEDMEKEESFKEPEDDAPLSDREIEKAARFYERWLDIKGGL